VDAFVLAKLEAAGLEPAPPADKATLLRRVTFDLTGLPPSPEEIRAFLADASPRAYEKAVERLLASERYGERWARHWLDVVRFAETSGHEFDFEKQEAWRYRDYVIRAFNQDVPYDRFVKEHLAGDLLPDPRVTPDGAQLDSPVGTGLFGFPEERNGATDLLEVRAEKMDSRIDVFGKAFLGLTIACARCHDHKFDPIPTADYYALGGVFESTQVVLGSIQSPAQRREAEAVLARGQAIGAPEAPRPPMLADEVSLDGWRVSGLAFSGGTVNGMIDSRRGGLDKPMGTMISKSFVPTKKYIHVRLAGTKFNPVREHPSLLAVTIFANGRYPKGVAGDGDGKLRWKTITLHEEIGQICHLEIADRRTDGHIVVDRIVFSDSKEPPAVQGLPEKVAAVEAQAEAASLPAEPFAMLAAEDNPRNLRIHVRGNHLNPGEEVPRGFLRVFSGGAAKPYTNGSGRLELAEALFAPDNPLTARVMVNRIWKHHFGEGLVRTTDNFGRMGERPSHPELLDYLARRFREGGWSVKAMHREMVLSSAYRMSSAASGAATADPGNRLLSHMRVRRLEGEAIRDAILSATGSLNLTPYGPGVTPHIGPYQDGRGKPASGPLDGGGRRSVYLEVRRNFITPLFLAFDYPLPSTTVGRRSVSTVPSQALMLMNNEFVSSEAAKWAGRILRETADWNARLDAMYLRAFGRAPDALDRKDAREFLAEQAKRYGGDSEDARPWSDLAHMLFNSKEFIFVR
jgi:hypothetical protein